MTRGAGDQSEDDRAWSWLALLRDGTHHERVAARFGLAAVFERRGQLDEAIELLETNIVAGERSADVVEWLADLYRARGDHARGAAQGLSTLPSLLSDAPPRWHGRGGIGVPSSPTPHREPGNGLGRAEMALGGAAVLAIAAFFWGAALWQAGVWPWIAGGRWEALPAILFAGFNFLILAAVVILVSYVVLVVAVRAVVRWWRRWSAAIYGSAEATTRGHMPATVGDSAVSSRDASRAGRG